MILLMSSSGSAVGQVGDVSSPSDIFQEMTVDIQLRYAARSVLFPETRRSGQVGDLAYGSVQLDGRNLFDIAAPSPIADGLEPRGANPVNVRIKRVENRLKTFLREHLHTRRDLESLSVAVTQSNTLYVVQASTAAMADPVTLATVTDDDTEIYGTTTPEVGGYFAKQIQQGLSRAYREREISYIQKVVAWAGVFWLLAGLLSFLLWRLSQRTQRRQWQLREELRSLSSDLTPAGHVDTPLEEAERADHLRTTAYSLKRRLNRQRIHLQGLMLAQGLLWLLTVSFCLRLFPQTRTVGLLFLNRPIAVAFTWGSIILIWQANLYVTERLVFFFLQHDETISSRKQERLQKRLPTLADTLKGFVQAILIIIGMILSALFIFGFSGFQLFASAGVVGVAASIVFQSALQDIISGAMLLWHDAYAIGDVITVGDSSGKVEAITLLMTQLRSAAGELISLRNGTIDNVKNLTKEWSRLNVAVDVALNTDTDKALHLMGEIFAAMAAESEWRTSILEEPDILAVDRLAYSGVTLIIRAKTAPMQQWSVTREYLRRLKQSLDEAGIEFGVPQQTIKVQT
ncbi:transporter, MscS family [Synechococcus sp. PCC 7335]|nr:transporter, MscS family [Synechococcus sp. PCC 7335]